MSLTTTVHEAAQHLHVPAAAIELLPSRSEVYVSVCADGEIRYSRTLEPGLLYMTPTGTPYFDEDGQPRTYLGCYELERIRDGFAELNLLSPLPCPVYDWCHSHSQTDGVIDEPTVHSAVEVSVGAFLGHEVRAYRVNIGGSDATAVYMPGEDFDYELDPAGLSLLADDLERMSKTMRGLARKAQR